MNRQLGRLVSCPTDESVGRGESNTGIQSKRLEGRPVPRELGAAYRSWRGQPLAARRATSDYRGVDPMSTPTPEIVSGEEWEAARAALLVKEKEVTRARR